jgi:hypothetical protein
MSEPKRLTVEYDDGSTTSIDFATVTGKLRLGLAESGLCSLTPRIGAAKHYVLLDWDGWQEVFAIDADTVDLLRYFVIRRIEDRGRLSFNVGAEDPELSIVKRLPRELKGIVVANAAGMKTYDLTSEVERWEGVFESGGKIEYVKYDETDPQRQHGASQNAETEARLRDMFKRELTGRGLDPAKLLEMPENQRIDAYRQIARAVGIRGKERQEDVYGFIELMIRALNASRA